jgi:hypothetical protein
MVTRSESLDVELIAREYPSGYGDDFLVVGRGFDSRLPRN